MSASQIWRRLLWKEFREGRFVLLIVALAPLMIRAGWHAGPEIAFAMMVVPAIGIHLAIAFWATSRGGSRRTGGEFSWTHLPTSPAIEWLASMIVPTIIIAAVGAWFGWCAIPPTVNEVRTVSVPVAGMLDLATTFVICYLISMVISSWAGYIIGVFRLFGGTLIFVSNLSLMLQPDAVQTVERTLIGAIIGTFIFVAPFRKKSLAFRQATSLLAVVLIAFVPLVPQIPIGQFVGTWMASRMGFDELGMVNAASSDGSVLVHPLVVSNKIYLVMHDYRRDIVRKRLRSTDGVFNAQPTGRVYMASAKQGRVGIKIREWDSVTDKVRTITTIPVKGRYFGVGDGDGNCSVSPDGRYMAILLKSLMRDATQDLWLLDLSRGNARIALPSLQMRSGSRYADENIEWQIAWPKGKVAVWRNNLGAITVDIKTLATKRITLNSEANKL